VAKGLPRLRRHWPSIELPGHRDHRTDATYSTFDYEALPPIERELDDDLRWLRAEAPVEGSLAERLPDDPKPSREATADQLELLLGGRELPLPRSFTTFIGSPEPRSRVRSCTACYLDLGDFPVPVAAGGWLIHFLSDQQWVLHWLIFVGADGAEAVVVTDSPLGFEADEDSPHIFVTKFDPSTTAAAVCAESFSEFLYRFWIENEIWYALAGPEKGSHLLTVEQAGYLEHYARSA
jgi:hypothetical protein